MLNDDNENKGDFKGFRYGAFINLNFHDYYDDPQELYRVLSSSAETIKTLHDLGLDFFFEKDEIIFVTDDTQVIEKTNVLWYDYKLEKFVGED